MVNRTDNSSLSWGRLLRQTAATVQQQQAEIEALKRDRPTRRERAQAQQVEAERRRENTRAKQMIASSSTTAEDYASLDQSMLSVAAKEQIRHNLLSMKGAEITPLPPMSPEAQLRIHNWQRASQANNSGMNAFAQVTPPQFSAEPPSPYQRWLTNQNRPETQRHNQQMQLEQNQREVQAARLRQIQQSPRSGGINFNNPHTPN